MDREIKFRAWHREWKSLDKVIAINWDKNQIELESSIGNCDWVELGDIELMQYTGLHDKNGMEIYEGDIIKIGNNLIEEVKWIELGDWMGDKQPMVGFVSHGTIYKKPLKIIGNIYENPDLLTP